jgi:hypothetical protein
MMTGFETTGTLVAQEPRWRPVVEGRIRLGVTGGRYFQNRDLVMRVFMLLNLGSNTTLVHGGAPGADTLAASVAEEVMGWELEEHPADWSRLGKAAGPRRNQEMVNAEPGLDLLVAFPGGYGTEDMVRRAREAGILILRVEG